ncbi:IclR family transcriptional regulator [Natrialba aegyptia]|uniref:Transcriptional regulator n=1 Tax=Natrialba aegyptia DSM 13077 TaxID=1227491 RepID=M0AIL9_9EURY|nr:IclR family transcriptional regulator [Natrialba aegyptia]ELY97747.1 transcriptional regulator [Natrialba aegyptia DSM 13077]
MNADGHGETIDATARSLSVLNVLIDTPEPVGVTEIASQTAMTKSTVHKHVSTLANLGYVTKVGRQYEPSIRFLDCARRVQWDTDLVDTAREPVDELAAMANEVAGFVVEQNGVAVDVYCADQYASGTFPAYNTRHLHCSAAGKAILAALPDERLESELPALTPHTITDGEELQSELDRIRERGFSLDRQEQFAAVNSVAVSVETDSLTGAVYVSGRADELSGKRFEENIPGLLLSASRLLTDALE